MSVLGYSVEFTRGSFEWKGADASLQYWGETPSHYRLQPIYSYDQYRSTDILTLEEATALCELMNMGLEFEDKDD